jgi:small-conductance mechanosensitive channel
MEVSAYFNLLSDKLVNWSKMIVEMVPNFVLAIIALLLFILIGKFVRKIISKILNKAINNKSLSSLISRIIYVIVVTIGFFVSLSLLNLDKTVTSLLVGAGIVGLALSFALKDIATNFIAGFFMAVKRPFRIR